MTEKNAWLWPMAYIKLQQTNHAKNFLLCPIGGTCFAVLKKLILKYIDNLISDEKRRILFHESIAHKK